MVNNVLINDIKKCLDKTSVSTEYAAGEAKRRYEPNCGIKKHNERIHKESIQLDKYGNLPFNFGKPKKDKVNNLVKCCSNCGHIVVVNKNTIGIICPECKEYSKVILVEEPNSD